MIANVFPQPTCLPEIVDRIVRQFHPLKIIIFGSWARGEARWDSDVDLLVVLPKVEHKRKATIQIGNALSDMPISKDIVVTTPKEIMERGQVIGDILLPALREGKTIYEHQ